MAIPRLLQGCGNCPVSRPMNSIHLTFWIASTVWPWIYSLSNRLDPVKFSTKVAIFESFVSKTTFCAVTTGAEAPTRPVIELRSVRWGFRTPFCPSSTVLLLSQNSNLLNMFKPPSNSNLRLDSVTIESDCASNPGFGLAPSPPDLTVAILTRSQEPMAFAQVVDTHIKGSDLAWQLKLR